MKTMKLILDLMLIPVVFAVVLSKELFYAFRKAVVITKLDVQCALHYHRTK